MRSGLGSGWVNIHNSHHSRNTVTETACMDTLVCIIPFVQEGTHTAMTAVCCGIFLSVKLGNLQKVPIPTNTSTYDYVIFFVFLV